MGVRNDEEAPIIKIIFVVKKKSKVGATRIQVEVSYQNESHRTKRGAMESAKKNSRSRDY